MIKRLLSLLLFNVFTWGMYFLFSRVFFEYPDNVSVFLIGIPIVFPILFYLFNHKVLHISISSIKHCLIQCALFIAFEHVFTFIAIASVRALDTVPSFFEMVGLTELVFGVVLSIGFILATIVSSIIAHKKRIY